MRRVLALLLALVLAVSATAGIHLIVDRRLIPAYLMVFTGFLSYFLLHYLVNGTVIDSTFRSELPVMEDQPSERLHVTLVLIAAGITGVAVLLYGLYQDVFLISTAGTGITMAGYGLAHRMATGELL